MENLLAKKLITEETILELGFVKHSEYTYKMFMNNVYGYLDEIEVFFEPNEEICITLRQKTFSSDLDKNHIFIRNMKKLYELHDLVVVLTGSELTDNIAKIKKKSYICSNE